MLVLLLCGLVAWSVLERWQIEREMAARRAVIEAEYNQLHERFEALKADVEYLRDERSLEAEIRKHFDVAREGESVVILLDEDVAAEEEIVVATTTTNQRPWWQFWR